MPKSVRPQVMPYAPSDAVSDRHAREALKMLSLSWQARNGETDGAFVSRAEFLALKKRVEALEGKQNAQ